MILTVTLNPAIDKAYAVDSFEVGDVFRPSGMWATAGGKGLNVSRVASIMGEEVVATGFLGGGNGQFIRKQFKKQGIHDAFIEIEEETRICIAINDPIRNTSTEILETGPAITLGEQSEFLNNFKKLALKADIVTISGSLPQGLPIDFYGQLIDICRRLDKRVLLDTSGETLLQSIKYKPFMIKPNDSELSAISGNEMTDEKDILKSAERIHDSGIDIVAITLGKEGSIVVTDKGAFRLHTPPIETISSVGSGDSFLAGSAIALVKGESIDNVLKTATACGMANTQFAQTGHVTPKLVDEFFNMVLVKKY